MHREEEIVRAWPKRCPKPDDRNVENVFSFATMSITCFFISKQTSSRVGKMKRMKFREFVVADDSVILIINSMFDDLNLTTLSILNYK